jgi:hypothetical protein
VLALLIVRNFEKIIYKPKNILLMKKTIYTCLPLLFTIITHAQITKGSKLLGGNAGFSSNSFASGSTISTANIGLSYGCVVKDNTVNGFSVGFGFGNQPGSVTDPLGGPTVYYRTRNFSYSAGVFKRRYLPLGKSFYLFGQGGADVGHMQAEYNQSAPAVPVKIITSRQYSINTYFYPGVSYQFSKRCLLDLSLPPLVSAGFSHTTNGPGSSKSSSLYLSSNLNLSNLSNVQVGFRVLLAPKRGSRRA